ncbi:Hypothetical Protein MfeM64YM_0054 [Mycoplasmopsis fermentans M64]|uniref:Uncharacterized protein n=1 Tax=Mycoplasmopsis fermentans (strain M64) TaxID=943945 RepID=A0AB32XAS1_MYCFM|nr:Hypothetical Protein MfeM64YM_0054 [Mycoplasmopsis fermentans M64]
MSLYKCNELIAKDFNNENADNKINEYIDQAKTILGLLKYLQFNVFSYIDFWFETNVKCRINNVDTQTIIKSNRKIIQK